MEKLNSYFVIIIVCFGLKPVIMVNGLVLVQQSFTLLEHSRLYTTCLFRPLIEINKNLFYTKCIHTLLSMNVAVQYLAPGYFAM